MDFEVLFRLFSILRVFLKKLLNGFSTHPPGTSTFFTLLWFAMTISNKDPRDFLCETT